MSVMNQVASDLAALRLHFERLDAEHISIPFDAENVAYNVHIMAHGPLLRFVVPVCNTITRCVSDVPVRGVRATTGKWQPHYDVEANYSAFIDFEEGAAATAVYNGYGRFSSIDLCFNVGEWGQLQPAETRTAARRPSPSSTPQAELRAKQERAKNAIPGSAPFQPFFGHRPVRDDHPRLGHQLAHPRGGGVDRADSVVHVEGLPVAQQLAP